MTRYETTADRGAFHTPAGSPVIDVATLPGR
jgi:hypothetical protein